MGLGSMPSPVMPCHSTFISDRSAHCLVCLADNIGVGERESRVFSPLVAARHWHMGHGMGRSGELGAIQPKAAGSSLIAQLTRHLVLDAIHISGTHRITVRT